MNLITDEMLNKYLDGELSAEESKSLEEMIKSDVELNKRFIVLKKIHQRLSSLKSDEVSNTFTGRVMMRISKRYKVPKDQKYFIMIMFSIFGVMCLSIIGYVVIKISAEISQTAATQTNETINNYSQNIVQMILNILSGMNISVLGSILSIILLVSGYFFFEMSRHSKANLSN